MRFYADLHVHSRFSRATAKSCDLGQLAFWAQKKGIGVVATGDFTHPAWIDELKQNLVPAEPGLFELEKGARAGTQKALPASCRGRVRFMLSVEISTIYKKGERTRKVHHVVYVPDFESAERFTRSLARIGNLSSDGRPILGLDSRDLLEIVLESGEGCHLVPAHIWTPWFSALGSKSGFDSIDECYADLAPHIFAVETGLSSDPAMNWQVASLDRFRLVSSSDAHSPAMLGREACIFDTDPDYHSIFRALREGEGYEGTVEFFPEEGKYHLDGHRKCSLRLTPEETRQYGGRCPRCGGLITVGVMSRVEELAEPDRRSPPATAGKVCSLVPLAEVIAEIQGVGAKSVGVQRTYERLLAELGPELFVLSSVDPEDIRRRGSSTLAEAINRLRAGRVIREPGYDGEYGVIRLFDKDELGCRRRGGLLFPDQPARAPATGAERECAEQTGGGPDAGAHSPRRRRAKSAGSVPTAGPAPTAAGGPTREGEPLSGLDAAQRAAAEAAEGPVLIAAGPGSGKTRTLTHRLAHLVRAHGARPESCLALTFTRRAAGEMRERLLALLPEGGERFPVLTFHALGLSLLTEFRRQAGLPEGFRVAAEAERLRLLEDRLGVREREARRLMSEISRVKRTRARDGERPDTLQALEAYQKEMQSVALLDFDDLVGVAADLLQGKEEIRELLQQRFGWISVDEYQDVDAAQYRLLRLLVSARANICAIGDPDQSIYGFRGSDPRFFHRFQQDYPGARLFTLTANYRSGSSIVQASSQVMAPGYPERRSLEAILDTAGKIVVHEAPTERAEAEFVVQSVERLLGGHSFFSLDSGRSDGGAEQAELGFADFAVLLRTEAQAEPVREALARSGIPFQLKSHQRLYEQPGVRELIGRLEERVPGCRALESLREAAERVASEAGEEEREAIVERNRSALEMLEQLARTCGDDLQRFRREVMLGEQIDTWDPRADRVSLLTLHAAKGLEFPVVFILGCEQGILPLVWPGSEPDAVEEERRLFYVGMTRSKQNLFLCRARKRRWQGKVRQSEPSPFLRDIQEGLLERSKGRSRMNRTPDSGGQLDLF
jgi:DNA helicase-2/ATP-dependent DNA helicase PcrA